MHKGSAGELFAKGALFAEAYHCEAVASETAAVGVCAKADLLAAMARSPTLGVELL